MKIEELYNEAIRNVAMYCKNNGLRTTEEIKSFVETDRMWFDELAVMSGYMLAVKGIVDLQDMENEIVEQIQEEQTRF